MEKHSLAMAAALAALAMTAMGNAPAWAQLMNPCPYTNDGDCDEPNGLGYCAWGTDVADCSDPNSNYGNGSGFGGSAPVPPGGVSSTGLLNPCPYTNDGDCDEPNGLGYCDWGTDVADCSNPSSNYGAGSGYVIAPGNSMLLSPCPYLNDGDCDEPEGLGLCAEGTDVADCSNPNSNYGGGSGYAGGSSAPPPQSPMPQPVAPSPVTGTWTMSEWGNTTGTATVRQISQGVFEVTLRSNDPNVPVPVQTIPMSFDPPSGKVGFTIPSNGTRFEGVLQGGRVTGEYWNAGSRRVPWGWTR